MYKKILVPLDGSTHATVAAKHALQIALNYGSQVTFIYIVADLYNSHRYIGKDYNQLKEAFIAQSENILDNAIKEVQIPNVTINKKMVVGHPAEKIVEECKTGEYDLVVIGSRGLSSIQGFFMGGVSSQVANHAPCPVLIVR
jgi:nucleotide-binding universal stress UspA family protein